MAAIDDAAKALQKQYSDAHKVPNPVVGCQVGVAPAASGGGACINIYVNSHRPDFHPPESAPGVGYQGFQCVSYKGPVDPGNFISDSGPIAPPP